MDVDDDEGEDDAKEETIAQGASTNKKATANKVVKSKLINVSQHRSLLSESID